MKNVNSKLIYTMISYVYGDGRAQLRFNGPTKNRKENWIDVARIGYNIYFTMLNPFPSLIIRNIKSELGVR
jgi:hypothetical protein